MAKLHLVWNTARTECVGFLNEGDANYTASGDRHELADRRLTPTLGDAFLEIYGDEAPKLPQTTVEVPS